MSAIASVRHTLWHRFSIVLGRPRGGYLSRGLCPPSRVNLSPSTRFNYGSVPVIKFSEAQEQLERPVYKLAFTCRPCRGRSTHTISKQAYHNGTVLITCPCCNNRHVFADHLKIFSDTARSLEEILAENGEILKRGQILPGGDVEIFPSERTTKP